MDKKDLEELDKWKREKKNYVETYGVDIFHKKKKKPVTKVAEKLFNFLYRIAKILLIITIFAIIIGTFVFLYMYYDYLDSKLHADPVENISIMYGKNAEIVSENIDDNRNGIYTMVTEEKPEIEFYAVVNWNQMAQDYSDRYQKYYYEHWQNENKDIIKTNETYTHNILLQYEQYIEITEPSEIEPCVDLVLDFLNYSKDAFYIDWNLHFVVNNKNVYVYLDSNKEKFINTLENAFNQTEEID